MKEFWIHSTITRKMGIIISLLILLLNIAIVFGYFYIQKPYVIQKAFRNNNKVALVYTGDQFVIDNKAYKVPVFSLNLNKLKLHKDSIKLAPETNQNIKQPLDGQPVNPPANDKKDVTYGAVTNNNNISSKPAQKQPSKIAVIIINTGLSRLTSNEASNLPEKIAIGISSYANNLAEWEGLFVSKGHEVYAHLPLESLDSTMDNGYLALLSYTSLEDNLKNLSTNLEQFQKVKGIYVFGEESFTASKQAAEVLLKLLSKNLQILYLNPELPSYTKHLFQSQNIKYLSANILADEVLGEIPIGEKLKEAVTLAKKNGKALIVLRPYPISITTLRKWLDDLLNDDSVILSKISELEN
ncbi:divergent polysaccharide deacetylase family protein [Rickettsiales endosymbiont of Stachyamoeba lipophora]|uniref:divergent polysaccharide deacetylase family protein n=1 Tax=Rickettsiales endosymbiont of Stachyamoeba lipophora TaxID=2486578 RepID=UPI000F6454E8|nr:divergent polysaccharide deacetylase family protein [Rickettsiales endosymbiont of Stachyamoeba lipophora]AZL16184.1 divergent polysaccharide deacetylase family protein [Rickettsiales endosymbiont of Stachyamoeba lipophora]